MKKLIFVISFLVSVLSQANAETTRSLGTFNMQISPAPWEPRINRMDIGAPAADTVYGDFKYSPYQEETVDFGYGSGGSYKCDTDDLEYSFDISELDENGSVVSTTNYKGFPKKVVLKSNTSYLIKHSVSHFPTPCEAVNTSFLVFPSDF